MKVIRWGLVVMTLIAIGATLYEAGWGNPVRLGVVLVGILVSIFGVILTAIWGPE